MLIIGAGTSTMAMPNLQQTCETIGQMNTYHVTMALYRSEFTPAKLVKTSATLTA